MIMTMEQIHLHKHFLFEEGWMFITKIDGFFTNRKIMFYHMGRNKKCCKWISCPKILPFGRKLLQSSDVNVSDDGTVPTTFVFDSPVFLQQGNEYCIVLTNSLDYRAWISQLGELMYLDQIGLFQHNHLLEVYLNHKITKHGHQFNQKT